ncbi:hypothetical protein BDV36DRAFT_270787 [Aspergillus pseudocaelatus]|uniref:Uncharacterized protein n=1 Tax=Aspergillus pseudocaelatus TaxID=1825620 RepID=A0ABQ6W6G3_9EURO|nr:hypothetical protein BDV36DRAFT_270787 [Aspergillus pseudocaelatus]
MGAVFGYNAFLSLSLYPTRLLVYVGGMSLYIFLPICIDTTLTAWVCDSYMFYPSINNLIPKPSAAEQ